VTACSTGEEAYSLAIMLDSYLHKSSRILNVKIFATDIDETAIDIASKGMYSDAIAKDIPADLLDRYFTREGRKYLVAPYIRKQIVFAKHNIIKDPPFIKNDLISCRNMLIYMNGALQKKILSSFHFSLNNNGYLFLGSSESVSSLKINLKKLIVDGRYIKRVAVAGCLRKFFRVN
jgi:two-component system CheB/CheR fusion protein